MIRTVACPTCAKTVTWTDTHRWRPFCSERCRLIDLGDWLSQVNCLAEDTERDLYPMREDQRFLAMPRNESRPDTED